MYAFCPYTTLTKFLSLEAVKADGMGRGGGTVPEAVAPSVVAFNYIGVKNSIQYYKRFMIQQH